MNDKLNRSVLILNKSWVPITVVNVRRALNMLISNVAHVVDNDYYTYDFESWSDLGQVFEDGDFILTPRLRIPIPDVLVLKNFSRLPLQKIPFSRLNLYRRDELTCQYCGKKPGSKELTIDHVVPKSKGGHTTWLNCVLACGKCNFRKSDKRPEERGLKLLRQPFVPAPAPSWYAIQIGKRRITWEKFLNKASAKDSVASELYWNTELID